MIDNCSCVAESGKGLGSLTSRSNNSIVRNQHLLSLALTALRRTRNNLCEPLQLPITLGILTAHHISDQVHRVLQTPPSRTRASLGSAQRCTTTMAGSPSSEWRTPNGRAGGGARRAGRAGSNSAGDRSSRSTGDWRVVRDFAGDLFGGGGHNGRGRR